MSENKFLLQAYKEAVARGYRHDINRFYETISGDEKALNASWNTAREKGYKHDVDAFAELLGVKKKDQPEIPSPLEQPSPETESASSSTQAPGATSLAMPGMFAAIPQIKPNEVRTLQSISRDQAKQLGYADQLWVDANTRTDVPKEPSFLGRVIAENARENKVSSPQATAFAGAMHNMAQSDGFVGGMFNVFDEMAEGWMRARPETKATDIGVAIADAIEGGEQITEETVNAYLDVLKQRREFQEKYGTDEYYEAFEADWKRYSEETGSVISGWFSAISENPAAAFTSGVENISKQWSASQGRRMAEAALTTMTTFTAAGALATAPIGGVGAAPAFVASLPALLPAAFGWSGFQLERGLETFGAIEEYILSTGRDVDAKTLHETLNNRELMLEIISDATNGAAIIGAVDMLTAGAGKAISRPIIGQAKEGVEMATRAGLATLATTPVEFVGEGAGEALKVYATDENATLEDIVRAGLEEATGSVGGSVRSTVGALTDIAIGNYRTETIINGRRVSTDAAASFIQNADPATLLEADITVTNNKRMSQQLEERKERARVEANIDESIQGADRAGMVELVSEQNRLNKLASESTNKEADKVRQAKIKAIQDEIDVINEKHAERAVAEQTRKLNDPLAEAETRQPVDVTEGVTVDEVINRRATLAETGQEGDVYVDGQTVVLETEDKIYELGNVDEISDSDISDLGITVREQTVEVNRDGTLNVDGNTWNIQTDLDNRGVEYDKNGNVTAVSLKNANGETTMYKGQKAEDIAYQILLSEAQTPEQEQRVNEALEQDDEFRRQNELYAEQRARDEQLGDVETTAQEGTNQDTAPGAKPKVKQRTKEKTEEAKARERSRKAEEAGKRRAQSVYRRMLIANNPKEQARLLAHVQALEASGVEFTPDQKDLFDKTAEKLKNNGYEMGTSVKVGDEWTPRTPGKAVFVPDPTAEADSRVISQITNPGITKDGKVISPPTYVVRVGTKPIETTKVNGRDVRTKARDAKGLKGIMSDIFNLDGKKADAVAKLGDRLVGNMAKRAGITKSEMYDRISFATATDFSQANNIDNAQFQAQVKKLGTGVTVDYLSNLKTAMEQMQQDGRLTLFENEISEFTGPVVLHSPDTMFAGVITLPDGRKIIGSGGVLYPIVFNNENYFWAGTKGTIEKTVRRLNEAAARSTDGKVRMALTAAPQTKKLSNTTVARGIVDIITSVAFDERFSLSEFDVKKILITSAKQLGIKDDFNMKSETPAIIAAIKDKLDPEKSSFEDRKKFSEAMLGNAAKVMGKKVGKSNASKNAKIVQYFAELSGLSPDQIRSRTRKDQVASKAGMIDAIASLMEEPLIKNVTETDVIYAVIEVDVNPDGDTFRAVDTQAEGRATHESFPFAVVPVNPENKVKVHLTKDHKKYYDVVGSEENKSPLGDRSLRAYPTNSGLSERPLNIVAQTKEEVINEFLADLEAAKAAAPRRYWSVDIPSRENLEAGRIIATEDGYGLVKPDGDIVGVFKKHDSTAPNVAADLMDKLIKSGGIKLDNFDVYLTGKYEAAGFRVVSRTPFNEQYAPEGWDKATHGTPDVVFMIYDPEKKLKVQDGVNAPMFNSYDEAMRHRDSFVEQIKSKDKEKGYENMHGIQHYQDRRAAVVIDGVKATVYALNNPDVTSPLHELAHVFESYLTDAERETILKWAGHNEWTTDTSEAFAGGFEKYLSEGVAPDASLKGVFESMKQWLKDVYRSITNSPLQLELNDEMRALYSMMLNEGNPDNVTTGHGQKRTLFQDSTTKRFNTGLQQALFWIRVKFQDRFAPVMKIQEDLIADGIDVYESQDFKMAEELMHGKTENDLTKKVQPYIERLTESLKKHGIDVEDLNLYMMARHAKERNAYILDKFEKENGSGVSDDWADNVLASYADREDAFNEAASHVYDLLQETRERMVEFGLETQGIVDQWEGTYENYVPLYGFALDEMLSSDENTSSNGYLTGGAGIHVAGPTSKKAKGRTTKAANVVGNAVQFASAVVIKSRKNEALQSLYNLLMENESESYYISDKSTGKNSVGVRVNGEQKYMVFRDLSVAQALNGASVEKADFFTKMYKWGLMGWMRKSYTTYNPEFFITNFARDMQNAIVTAMAEEDIEGGMAVGYKVAGALPKNTGRAWAALAYKFGSEVTGKGSDVSTETLRYIDEWEENGGKTGWAHIKSAEQIVNEINEATTGKKNLGQKAAVPFKATLDFVEGVNEVFENSIRLGAYISAREAGMSQAKAAQLSKNITVNFNKYGEYGKTLNHIWLFFNAGAQGTARLARSLFTLKPKKTPLGETRASYQRFHRAQYVAASLTALNSVLTAINLNMSGEDEDGELFYNKISDYEKKRNIIIMKEDGKTYYKIPLPYGLNAFAATGEAIASTVMGERDSYDATMFTIGSALDAFVPIQFSSSDDGAVAMLQSVAPSVLKPFVDMAANETYNGGRVTGENIPFGAPKPDSQLSKRAPESVTEFFKFMNEWTGGSVDVSGDVDFNPDYMWYYMEYVVGAPIVFGSRGIDLAKNIARKSAGKETADLEANDIIFYRKMYGEPSKYYDYRLFRERLQEVEQLWSELRNPAVDREIKKREDRYNGVPALIKMNNELIQSMYMITRVRLDKAEKMEDPIKKRNAINEAYELQRSYILMWNELYNKTRGKGNINERASKKD